MLFSHISSAKLSLYQAAMVQKESPCLTKGDAGGVGVGVDSDDRGNMEGSVSL